MSKTITMQELVQLQKDYRTAVENNHQWIVQSFDTLFDKIDVGEIMIEGYSHPYKTVRISSTEESNKRFSEYMYNWMENNTKD